MRILLYIFTLLSFPMNICLTNDGEDIMAITQGLNDFWFSKKASTTFKNQEDDGELMTKHFEVTICVNGVNALVVSNYGTLSTINSAKYAGINSLFTYSGGYGADTNMYPECLDQYNAWVYMDEINNKWSFPNVSSFMLFLEDRDQSKEAYLSDCFVSNDQGTLVWNLEDKTIFIFDNLGETKEYTIACDITYYKKYENIN